MNLEDLKLIQQLPKILNEIENLNNKIDLLISKNQDLTKISNVAKYLNVTTQTIYNYISNNIFLENIHYFKKINKNKVNIVFVESAIIKFKDLKT